jgi:hypothetical protein
VRTSGTTGELAKCEEGLTMHRPQRVVDMLLAHRIRLDPTPVQRDYFARAAGTRVRKDFMHKLTARLCSENQTVVIEDLNVAGTKRCSLSSTFLKADDHENSARPSHQQHDHGVPGGM